MPTASLLAAVLAPVLAAGLSAAAAWRALSPPQALTFAPARAWTDRLLAAAGARLQRGWSPETRRQAAVLGLTPATLLALTTAVGMLGAVLGVTLVPNPALAILGGLAAARWGPAWWVGRRYAERQAALAQDLPALALLLRIYIGLGQPLKAALQAARLALSPAGRAECDRLLAGIAVGRGPAALAAWADRVGLTEYAVLADTLAQAWDSGLAATALAPLDRLVGASREQGLRRLADRLDQAGTVVPVVAGLGLMVVGLYALFASAF